jgi:thiamine biosynthesis lipoprotein
MALDLGAIAKGFAADEAAAIAIRAGVRRAVIDFGGNIVVCGKPGREQWRIGLQNPLAERGAYIGIAAIPAGEDNFSWSVVTSGVYERGFEKDGIRYHHIFSAGESPANGYPVNNGLLSVTIIAHNSMDADALSTAVFVLGFEKGSELIETLPETEAVFIFDDKSVRITSGASFTLTNNEFRLR